jgi:hypothetical protein
MSPVNLPQNWKSWERRVEKIDYHINISRLICVLDIQHHCVCLNHTVCRLTQRIFFMSEHVFLKSHQFQRVHRYQNDFLGKILPCHPDIPCCASGGLLVSSRLREEDKGRRSGGFHF